MANAAFGSLNSCINPMANRAALHEDDGMMRCCVDHPATDIERFVFSLLIRISTMPHTFNADRRDKIAKQKYQVTNWPAYNESLRQRGDLTIWVKDEALSLWTARRRTSRGGQPKYSDLAMTLCLTLRVVYGLALRQTQGLMRSVAALMGFDIALPDFSTLSRRSKGLALPSTKSRATTSGPVHLVVDSTGVKVFGKGEWLENKHKTKGRTQKMAQTAPWSQSCQW